MADTEKKPKFNFEELKAGATSPNAKVRRKAFEEYFERFEEFPSYLFDNSNGVDTKLVETIRDIENDPETPKNVRKGIELLLYRLPDMPETA